MSPLDTSHILNGLQSVGNALGQPLVELTKAANDVVGSTAVDVFMDAVRGIGHRVMHGHSLDNLPMIYSKFGTSGVADYFVHGLRDVLSPHGMPIPFAKEIASALGMSPMSAVDWLCFNIGDLFSGGLSIVHSAHQFEVMREAVAAGHIAPELAISAALGSAVKIGFGVGTTNVVSVAAGAVDLGTLIWALLPALTMGKAYFVAPKGLTGSTIVLGGVSGAASAVGIGGVLHAFTSPNRAAWIERLKKISFAGAVGGVVGVGTSAISTNPVAISAAAVGGYVAGEWVYERVKEKSASKAVEVESNDFLPEFLTEAYALG